MRADLQKSSLQRSEHRQTYIGGRFCASFASTSCAVRHTVIKITTGKGLAYRVAIAAVHDTACAPEWTTVHLALRFLRTMLGRKVPSTLFKVVAENPKGCPIGIGLELGP